MLFSRIIKISLAYFSLCDLIERRGELLEENQKFHRSFHVGSTHVRALQEVNFVAHRDTILMGPFKRL